MVAFLKRNEPFTVLNFMENYYLPMSTITSPDLQTLKIKKKNTGQYSP